MILPVILSGGSGTRLWPLSRQAFPKQFLPLMGEDSLFQDTLARLSGLADMAKPLVICNQDHRFLVAEQLHKMDLEADIMLEPEGRNTAPAVACAAHHAAAIDPKTVLLVLPSDHVISQPENFLAAVEKGYKTAQLGGLVTFGIVADGPETGYGYIKRDEKSVTDKDVYAVAEFVEKPDLVTAKSYVTSGDYYWNSGMFMFTAGDYLAELQMHFPTMVEATANAVAKQGVDLDFLRLDKASFLACPAESIDYAVMEKTQQAKVIPMQAGWSDLGAWSALQSVADADQDNNVIIGDVLTKDVANCYLRAEHRLVAAIGLDDVVIVETADAVMVVDGSRSQDVKDIVNQLKASDREECNYHVRVFRPWGHYETVDESEAFKVKRISVNPGASLSLQMHHHRSEHWVVVRGTANVVKGNESLVLKEDQSIYIPVGTQHRLENPGVIPLEIIEVQTGSYLGEDDIVRFDDRYGR